ncbi:hypothetical protein PsYK624_148810 [Phanerochaete sordida]|uniref:F-box domain-containing protein n=1 Tax=Phanerochaete sordida TaxID=48140 RepID=A0A9P3GP87_9APHY|nr:hypothetical protein PsYK624_148810 [Phanerochaete sordida]
MAGIDQMLRMRAHQLFPPEEPSSSPYETGAASWGPLECTETTYRVYEKSPTVQGALPEDNLEAVFSILRDDEIEYRDHHHCFPNDARPLASCALVSSVWRALTSRHLFRDIVFTRRSALRGSCDNLAHDPTCCSPVCRSSSNEPTSRPESGTRPAKTLLSLLHFLRESPVLRRYVRTLRLRTSPLDVRNGPPDPVDATIVLNILRALPRAAVLHLEDIILSPSPATALREAPPLEHLTLSSCQGLTRLLASQIIATLSCFRRVRRLRIVHLWEQCSWRDPPSNADRGTPLPLSIDQFEFERVKFMDGDVFAFLAASATLGAIVRTTLPTDRTSAAQLRRFIQALGPRLAHLDFTLRIRDAPCPTTMILASVNPSVLQDPTTGAALDLSECTSLRTLKFRLNLTPAKLVQDLTLTVVPMLHSLRALRPRLPPVALTIVTYLDEMLRELDGAHVAGPVCHALEQVEEAILELQGLGAVDSTTFELEVAPALRSPPIDERVAQAKGLLRMRFSRCDACGDLQVAVVRVGAARVNVHWGGRYDISW